MTTRDHAWRTSYSGGPRVASIASAASVPGASVSGVLAGTSDAFSCPGSTGVVALVVTAPSVAFFRPPLFRLRDADALPFAVGEAAVSGDASVSEESAVTSTTSGAAPADVAASPAGSAGVPGSAVRRRDVDPALLFAEVPLVDDDTAAGVGSGPGDASIFEAFWSESAGAAGSAGLPPSLTVVARDVAADRVRRPWVAFCGARVGSTTLVGSGPGDASVFEASWSESAVAAGSFGASTAFARDMEPRRREADAGAFASPERVDFVAAAPPATLRERRFGAGRRLRIGRVSVRSSSPSATSLRQSWLTVCGRTSSPSSRARAASLSPSGDALSIRSTATRRSVGSVLTGRAILLFPSVFSRGAGDFRGVTARASTCVTIP
ncbi:hypothetical protein ACR9E3_03695 [Actinomycetospora sp. C-140]